MGLSELRLPLQSMSPKNYPSTCSKVQYQRHLHIYKQIQNGGVKNLIFKCSVHDLWLEIVLKRQMNFGFQYNTRNEKIPYFTFQM